ncbi:MAG: hypothetical protein JNM30_13270 [Rhodospirillales bacterium]|nr:hypothetical protein [Rhodospirillales bacterium]
MPKATKTATTTAPAAHAGDDPVSHLAVVDAIDRLRSLVQVVSAAVNADPPLHPGDVDEGLLAVDERLDRIKGMVRQLGNLPAEPATARAAD